MADEMNEVRMEAILTAYGADPARWPAEERAAALAWIAAHGDRLASAQADARALDAALARDARDQAPNDALLQRVLQGIPVAGERVVPFTGARGWNAGAIAALAACAVMGVVIGFNAAGYSEDSVADVDAAFGSAFGVDAERGVPGSEG